MMHNASSQWLGSVLPVDLGPLIEAILRRFLYVSSTNRDREVLVKVLTRGGLHGRLLKILINTDSGRRTR
jgi:hypothetical protein